MNISALDESGQPVDWWFIYKVPHLSKGANNDEASGYEYVYFDSTIAKSKHGKVAKSPNRLDQGSGVSL